MNIMARIVALFLITVFITGMMCRPIERFLDLDCNEEHNCTDHGEPICCTDGQTYPSKCHISRMNQLKACSLGDFNPVVAVHDGPCRNKGNTD